MALLWDPHPQYEFAAFGRHFHLILAHDSSFVHPDLQVSNFTVWWWSWNVYILLFGGAIV
jgi:hypothetical protein